MRPRTKLPIPEPTGSEFENFDRLARILASKTRAPQAKRKKAAKAKRQRRLPRP
jgi:hypothetical protein